jgi:CheY-like chemotaxis protein
MVRMKSLVLVAGIGRRPFEALAPVLDRHKLEVVQVAAPENSVELARSERFDLVIFDAEPRQVTLGEVVAMIRDERSESRLTSLLVLAEHRNADAARRLIGRGVNRVMLLDDPPKLIDKEVADLLHIAPRANIRLATRLRTSVADGTEEVLGEVVNLSLSGLLVQTDMLFEMGEQVVVSIYPGDRDDPVVAKAEVTRRALSERGGADGFGIRFLSLAADGELRIVTALEEAFANLVGL